MRRTRFLTRVEADRLIAELPEHLAAMVRFALETGLRKANVTGLQWSQVDLVNRRAWIHADQAKARRAIGVPLSAAAVIVIREQIGKHPESIFTYRGKPARQKKREREGRKGSRRKTKTIQILNRQGRQEQQRSNKAADNRNH